MSTYKWGDVVVVEAPYSDLSGSKLRPAVVAGLCHRLSQYDDIVLVAITSKIFNLADSCQLTDWQAAGLTSACAFKTQLFTRNPEVMIGKLGVLSDTDRHKLKSFITTLTAES